MQQVCRSVSGFERIQQVMKRITGFLWAFFLLLQVAGQEQIIVKNRQYYLEKGKTQKTVAWVLAGTGTILIIGGVAGLMNNNDLFGTGGEVEALMMVGGVPVALASLAFFAMAEKSKAKAEVMVGPILQPVRMQGTTTKLAPGIVIRLRIR